MIIRILLKIMIIILIMIMIIIMIIMTVIKQCGHFRNRRGQRKLSLTPEKDKGAHSKWGHSEYVKRNNEHIEALGFRLHLPWGVHALVST